MRRVWIGCIAVALLAAAGGAVDARADGLPVLGIDVGPVGVTTASGASRFVTLPAGANTLLARVSKGGGRVSGSRLLEGSFTIPAVAYDGSASGLSASGRTLVLIEPRVSFPRAETTLLVLGTHGLEPVRLVRLRGDFSFDAISPQGRWMYLIQYLSATDPTRYRVRSYDLASGRLLGRSIVDPASPGEKMRGAPLSRAMSADGRWAYTLYDGAGGTPFIHALDTARRTARCIDLDALAGRADLWRLRLRAGGEDVSVWGPKGRLLIVDRRTFEVGSGVSGWADAWGLPLRTLGLSLLGLLLAAGFAAALPRRWRGRIVVAMRAGRDATVAVGRSRLSGDG